MMGAPRVAAAAITVLALCGWASAVPAPAVGHAKSGEAAPCRTTSATATVAPWAKRFGLDKLSGNGMIYVRLPRWRATRSSGGALHHKMPWLFSPAFKSTAPVRFGVRRMNGIPVGRLSAGGPPITPGDVGPHPTALDVPSPGCYLLTATVGTSRFTATLRVF